MPRSVRPSVCLSVCRSHWPRRATTYADNVAVALYRRAAVRRAAVDRYILPAGMFAAVSHAGTDRRTDGHPTVP